MSQGVPCFVECIELQQSIRIWAGRTFAHNCLDQLELLAKTQAFSAFWEFRYSEQASQNYFEDLLSYKMSSQYKQSQIVPRSCQMLSNEVRGFHRIIH